MADEEEGSKKFNSKPRIHLTEKPVSFNGITLQRYQGTTKCSVYVPNSSQAQTTAKTITDTDYPTRKPTSKSPPDTHYSHDHTAPPSDDKTNVFPKVIQKQLRYRVTQEDKITKLKHADKITEFISARALSQYIGVNTRSDVCTPI